MRHKTPRGICNYNPGNIHHIHGVRWQGMSIAQTDPDFVAFNGPRWGIRAIARVLIAYQDKRYACDDSSMECIREIVERWTQVCESDTSEYVHCLSRVMEIDPGHQCVDVYHFETMRTLVQAIIRHENGTGPLPGGFWYGEPIIIDGLELAGISRGVEHGAGVLT